MALEVTIATPEGLAYRGPAEKVVVPAFDGEMGFLPRHAPLVGRLGAGELRVTPAGSPRPLRYFVEGGFVHVLHDKVTVLSTRAETGAALDPARAEEDLRALLAEALPPGAGAEIREARQERIRAAQARLKVAARVRSAG